MASESVGLSGWFSAHLTIDARITGDARKPISGSVPVAGRPGFLRLTDIDFAIITFNVKASRGEGGNFRPGSNPSHEGHESK
jgi:hypothetical protein